ncbi:MAG: AMP-binding protein, partial [Terriglobia bacterium]
MAGASIPATLNVADYFLDRHLREGRGARVAVRGVGTEVTYQELAERAGRVARAWRGLGLQAGSGAKPGDRVLLVLPDSPEFLACFLGTIKAGGVAVPVNPFTRSPDYAYYAGDCRPKLAVVHVTSLAEALPALTAAQSAPRVLTVGERAGGRERLEDVLGAGGASAETHASSAEHIAFFLYTSGSGGQPKAALHRHRH